MTYEEFQTTVEAWASKQPGQIVVDGANEGFSRALSMLQAVACRRAFFRVHCREPGQHLRTCRLHVHAVVRTSRLLGRRDKL
jgi:hypothetical protein